MWICICFLCQSHAALSAEPRQSCSAWDLTAQLSPQLLVFWITLTAQIVSNHSLYRGFIELLPPTVITTCELKQEQLYLSREEIGPFLGFGFVCFIESILHIHSSLCNETAFTMQVVVLLHWK